MDDDENENEEYENAEEGPTGPLYEEVVQYVTELCRGMKQPSGMW